MPDYTGVHVDRPLTNVSIRYSNPSYVADKLAPAVRVVKSSDKYFTYGRENFRIPYSLRADKSETAELTWSLSTDKYYCEEYGFHTLISDRERDNADEALSLDIDATTYITDCLQLDREYRVVNHVLDSTNAEWGTYSSTHFSNLGADWDDTAGADVRADIYFARFIVFRDSRRQANTMFIPVEVSYRLSQMEQIDELRKYTDAGLVTNSGIPGTLFGLKVYEAESSYNAGIEGGSASFQETFGNNVIIAYINPGSIGLRTLTFTVTFLLQAFETLKWREQKKKSDSVEVSHMYDTKIVAPAAGFVFTNAITATT